MAQRAVARIQPRFEAPQGPTAPDPSWIESREPKPNPHELPATWGVCRWIKGRRVTLSVHMSSAAAWADAKRKESNGPRCYVYRLS